MPAATLVGLYRNHKLFQKLAVPWAACALVKDCIAFVGASKDKGVCTHDPGSWYTIADDTDDLCEPSLSLSQATTTKTKARWRCWHCGVTLTCTATRENSSFLTLQYSIRMGKRR